MPPDTAPQTDAIAPITGAAATIKGGLVTPSVTATQLKPVGVAMAAPPETTAEIIPRHIDTVSTRSATC